MAYPVGGPGAYRYIVTEMHYDNPNMQEGKIKYIIPYSGKLWRASNLAKRPQMILANF